MCRSLSLAIFVAVVSAAGQAQNPAPHARAATNVIVQHGSASYLGVAVVEIDSDRAKALNLKEERGVEVKIVDENSPASKAGLKAGDVILGYNDQRIEGIAQFIRMVSETPPGHKATLQISRNGAPQTLAVTIEARSGRGGFAFSTGDMTTMIPPPAIPPVLPVPEIPWNTPRLGIETESLNPQLAEFFGVKEGVLVRFVSKGSAAEKAGIKAGDVITRVNGDSIRNAGEITMKIMPPNAGKAVSLTVVRNHKEISLEVVLNSDRRSEAALRASCYTA